MKSEKQKINNDNEKNTATDHTRSLAMSGD